MDLELRRDPQRLLEQIEEEERRKKRGRLKIFLGYASGVGKSAKMLAEGLRRRERGEDVVVGAIQPKSSGVFPGMKLFRRGQSAGAMSSISSGCCGGIRRWSSSTGSPTLILPAAAIRSGGRK